MKLRKERDKDRRDIRRTSCWFGFGKQINLVQFMLIVHSVTASHLPVTLDRVMDTLTPGQTGQQNLIQDLIKEESQLRKKEPSFNVTCGDDKMTLMSSFPETFSGRIYASDYSEESECGISTAGSPVQNVTLTLTLGQCGTKMTALENNFDSVQLLYEVTIYVQYSAFLQQMRDQRVTVFCIEKKGPGIEDNIEKIESSENVKPSTRQGRRLKDVGRNLSHQHSNHNSRVGEAIMEIIGGKDPSPKTKKMSAVAVGEDVTLVISTKVLRGYDARIVNCTTHDGSRASTLDGIRHQVILDSAGCSVDKSLVPNFRRRRLPVESRNRLITLHFVSFPAFKFPDRDHLHIQCSVAYCHGPCPQEPCDSTVNHFGSWRDKYGRIAEVLTDTSQVVNSIEVLSPDLDSPGGQQYERHQPPSPAAVAPPNSSELPNTQRSSQRQSSHYAKSPPFAPVQHSQFYSNENSQGYQNSGVEYGPATSNLTQYNVCISPGTVIIALVVLGLILVISITAILWFALKRSEVKKYAESHSSAFSSPGPSPYYRFNHW